MTPEIISLAEAKSQGLKHYFTGKPCKHGHVGLRVVSNSGCLICRDARMAKWVLENSERYKQVKAAWSIANRDKLNEARKNWLKENPGKAKEYHDRYHSKNPGVAQSYVAKRRAAKLERTPPWANLLEIQRIYKECPENMTVDHDIPLQGEFVSGLHVENNLRYLTPSANSSKGNSFQSQFEEFL